MPPARPALRVAPSCLSSDDTAHEEFASRLSRFMREDSDAEEEEAAVDDRGGLNDYRHFFPDRDFGWGSAVHRQKPSDG